MQTSFKVDQILEVLPDGRFVVVYNTDKIITLNLGDGFPDLTGIDGSLKCFLAGVAYARLKGTNLIQAPKAVSTEEL